MASANERVSAYEEEQKARKRLTSTVVDHHPRPRIGKTAKDKARGHIPYLRNRRVWSGSGPQDPRGDWIKA